MTTGPDFTAALRELIEESALDEQERRALLLAAHRLTAWPESNPLGYEDVVVDLVAGELRLLAPTLHRWPRRTTRDLRHWLGSRWVIAAAILSAASGGAAFSGALAHALHRVEIAITAPYTRTTTAPAQTPSAGVPASQTPTAAPSSGTSSSPSTTTGGATRPRSENAGDLAEATHSATNFGQLEPADQQNAQAAASAQSPESIPSSASADGATRVTTSPPTTSDASPSSPSGDGGSSDQPSASAQPPASQSSTPSSTSSDGGDSSSPSSGDGGSSPSGDS
jgi:hypothetical protein